MLVSLTVVDVNLRVSVEGALIPFYINISLMTDVFFSFLEKTFF